MVYSSDFYTTRSYLTRPVVSSYSVSYPVTRYYSGLSKVYSTTYPIYSYHSVPYIAHKRLVTGTRILSSPDRVITSPIRTVTRIIRSPYRVSVSPIRAISTPPSVRYYHDSVTPIRVITSPAREYRSSISPIRVSSPVPTYHYRTPSAVLAREYDRIAYKPRPRIGYLPLENYLNSESFINFDTETRKIRSSVQTLLREIHSPVPRYPRSSTPFVTYRDNPMSKYALDAYVARINDPGRHIVKEVQSMSYYPDPARKYIDSDLDPFRPSRKFVSTIQDKEIDVNKKIIESSESSKVNINVESSRSIIQNDDSYYETAQNNARATTNTFDKKATVLKREYKNRSSFNDKKHYDEESTTIKNDSVADANNVYEKTYKNLDSRDNDDVILVSERSELTQKELKQANLNEKIEDANKRHDKTFDANEKHFDENESKITNEVRNTELQDTPAFDAIYKIEDKAEKDSEMLEIDTSKNLNIVEKDSINTGIEIHNPEKMESNVIESTTFIDEEKQEIEAHDEKLQGEDEKRTNNKFQDNENVFREEEFARLSELEKSANEDNEAELARQAAELAAIARLEQEMSKKELQDLQNENEVLIATDSENFQSAALETPINTNEAKQFTSPQSEEEILDAADSDNLKSPLLEIYFNNVEVERFTSSPNEEELDAPDSENLQSAVLETSLNNVETKKFTDSRSEEEMFDAPDSRNLKSDVLETSQNNIENDQFSGSQNEEDMFDTTDTENVKPVWESSLNNVDTHSFVEAASVSYQEED